LLNCRPILSLAHHPRRQYYLHHYFAVRHSLLSLQSSCSIGITEGLREERPLLRIARDVHSLYPKAIRGVHHLNRSVERIPFRSILKGSI
ncbi:hypothetical protein RB213_007214, partial [Colletotrichum asianum]